MVDKTGSHGLTPEKIVALAMRASKSNDGFYIVGYDKGKPVGFMLAYKVPDPEPWVDFVALYTLPGVATKVKKAGFNLLMAWAKDIGATCVRTMVTRSPEVFYERFHKPLGFEKVGFVLEVKL